MQAVPFSFPRLSPPRVSHLEFGMLLDVSNRPANYILKIFYMVVGLPLLLALLAAWSQTIAQTPSPANPSTPPAIQQAAPNAQSVTSNPSALPRPGLNIVVLDPAHGGTDTGAHGTGGLRESEIVLEFAAQLRQALESQGFQVLQTRSSNENPSFDDRSAMANAQTGAVFVSLHISSTGLPGTARVYVNSDLPISGSGKNNSNALLPWDRAQAPFLPLSHKLGDIVQGYLTLRFKGSPNNAQSSAIRQLRTTAAPAIAVEISSVSVNDRGELDRMAPGVADSIARGIVAFRPSYVIAGNFGDLR